MTARPPLSPPLRRLLETAIYVSNTRVSMAFYQSVLGLPTLSTLDPTDPNPRLIAMDLQGSQVLLLFRRGGSTGGVPYAGGFIPGADANGTTHFAFAIDNDTYDAWKAHLSALNINIESEVAWERGGRSLYFRDPDQHLVELATPGVWTTY